MNSPKSLPVSLEDARKHEMTEYIHSLINREHSPGPQEVFQAAWDAAMRQPRPQTEVEAELDKAGDVIETLYQVIGTLAIEFEVIHTDDVEHALELASGWRAMTSAHVDLFSAAHFVPWPKAKLHSAALDKQLYDYVKQLRMSDCTEDTGKFLRRFDKFFPPEPTDSQDNERPHSG
jgi:hypothetical protein